jgi:putative Mg2+ transporter-C (MgtC) family protein
MNTIENELDFLLHIVIASILTGIIGIERGSVRKPAGLRTNMIVGGAVCLFMILGESVVMRFSDLGFGAYITTDPIRIIQAIVLGISFIGAGMVLHTQKEQKVKYLTSSATILFSAGIGISVALRQYILAVGVTLFVILINWLLAHTWLKKREN